MGKVIGIGGVFVRTRGDDALREWYKNVLGFTFEDWGGAMMPYPASGYSLWTASPEDSENFAPSTLPFMLNLVVDDLDGLLARVASAGVDVLGREDQNEFGRFAWILDPMGVKLELWEPSPSSS